MRDWILAELEANTPLSLDTTAGIPGTPLSLDWWEVQPASVRRAIIEGLIGRPLPRAG